MEPLTRVERRKEKTKRVLSEVALALFYKKGIYWTTIEDITERADVGKGTFYQYFETKEALLQELLEQGLDALLAAATEAGQRAGDGADPVTRIIQAQLAFYLEHPHYLLLFHQVRGLLQMRTQAVQGLREVYDRYLGRLAELMWLALGGQDRPGISARDLAMALSAFTSGLLTYHLLFDQEGLARRREGIQAQLERSLRALIAMPAPPTLHEKGDPQ